MTRTKTGGSSSPLNASPARTDAKKKAPSARLITSPAERPIHQRFVFVLLVLTLLLGSCAAPDTRHHLVISTREQKMALLDQGNLMAVYPVSTSKFGLGDFRGSNRTPLGELQIADKIGDGATLGAVFKDRRRTGEVLSVDAPGRDPIVTRILWLRGREAQNANAYARTIYIHGTPEERNIGRPASYGCIRMRSRDIINLYEIVGRGAQVTIVDLPLAAALPAPNSEGQMAAGSSSTGGTTSVSSH